MRVCILEKLDQNISRRSCRLGTLRVSEACDGKIRVNCNIQDPCGLSSCIGRLLIPSAISAFNWAMSRFSLNVAWTSGLDPSSGASMTCRTAFSDGGRDLRAPSTSSGVAEDGVDIFKAVAEIALSIHHLTNALQHTLTSSYTPRPANKNFDRHETERVNIYLFILTDVQTVKRSTQICSSRKSTPSSVFLKIWCASASSRATTFPSDRLPSRSRWTEEEGTLPQRRTRIVQAPPRHCESKAVWRPDVRKNGGTSLNSHSISLVNSLPRQVV
ncbi:hypothetical protein B0H16DRAFT_507788 [Mycena metata]|uniref:Uncharacterized protein n=1 Tax=Mycena metata TaxID=1033252 RepID=A0AAD7MFI4_9AGAR|nr:hypothetical protein B0H16DRAFT_507788 [Mycena metata]